MFGKTKKYLGLMVALSLIFLVGGSQITFAEDEKLEKKVIYKNNNIIRDVANLKRIAKEAPKFYEGPKFLMQNKNEGKYYYEKGKVYRVKTSNPKQVIQKVSSIKRAGNVTNSYIADAFATITIEEKILDQDTINKLGLQRVDSTILDAESRSLLEWSNEAWSGSYGLKIKYTVSYDTSSEGRYKNLICFHSSTGEILYADTASGIRPTSGKCHYSMHGKAFDFSTSPHTFLGTESYGNIQTVSSPKIGTSYSFTLNPDIYVDNIPAATIATSWTVDATRGVSTVVTFEP